MGIQYIKTTHVLHTRDIPRDYTTCLYHVIVPRDRTNS